MWRRRPKDGREAFAELLINRRVYRVPGSEKNGIDVLIFVQMRLVKGQFPVHCFGLAETPHPLQAIGPEVGEHVLYAPQTACPQLNSKSDLTSGSDELRFDVARH